MSTAGPAIVTVSQATHLFMDIQNQNTCFSYYNRVTLKEMAEGLCSGESNLNVNVTHEPRHGKAIISYVCM